MNDTSGWLLRLRATEPQGPPVASPVTVAIARDSLGDGPIGWAGQTARVMAEEVVRQIPEYGGGPSPFETFRRSVEAAVLAALVGLCHDVTPDGAMVPEETVQGNADLVRRGVPLDRVLRGVRLGHALLHRALIDAVDGEPEPVRLAEHHRVSDLLFAYADVHASRMAEEYIAERDRWRSSTEAARRRVVEDVVAARSVTAEAASRTLGYDLTRHHQAFLVNADALETLAEDLRRLAVEAARAVGGDGVLIIPAGTAELWAWTSWPARPAETERSLRERLDVPDGLRLVAGPIAHGVAGFRRSHLGALEAERLAAGARLTCFSDVRVTALLTADQEQARWFAEETLGGLYGTDERARELRETLRVYLACARSPQEAAALLHIARNTVTYRVKRAEELLGKPLSGDLLEVRLALEIARTLP
ncbi:PucR family transcriptional regulator [Spirillospora sp. NPDC048911]|uniref:PucR family transcriptional regulator n=1 Tax=Spirillospora sp. NPDC048911 TaxID=3364527 RepID=UPI00371E39B3